MPAFCIGGVPVVTVAPAPARHAVPLSISQPPILHRAAPAPSRLQVVKAASGKFHPLHQWLYFDSIESLPDEPLPAEEVAPQVGGPA